MNDKIMSNICEDNEAAATARMKTSRSEWVDTVLVPAIYERVPEIFTWLKWEHKGKKWVSRQHLDGRTDGERSDGGYRHRPQWTTNITADRPYIVKDYAMDAREVVSWYAEYHHLDRTAALKALAAACGIPYPFGGAGTDDGAWKREEEVNIARQQAHVLFMRSLAEGKTAAAIATRAYLRRRGWDDDTIAAAEVGVVDRDTIAALPASIRDEFTDGRIGSADGQYYLVIALHSGGRYYGFKVRTIADGDPRYINTKGTSKADHLFGLSHTSNLILCEGELDTLHAHAVGLTNVAATAGGAASKEQLLQAIRYGVTSITLLFDNDDRGREFEARTIDTIVDLCADGSITLGVYVAHLPYSDDLGRSIKDIDDYLVNHSANDLHAIIDRAAALCDVQIKAVTNKYIAAGGIKDRPRLHTAFFKEVGDILYAPTTPPVARERLFKLMEGDQERLQFDIADLREYARRHNDTAARTAATATVRKAIARATAALNDNDIEAATATVKEAASLLTSHVDRDLLAATFATRSAVEEIDALATDTPGIPTSYLFADGKDGHRQPLTLKAGLTFICGCTGHGKTSFLNSLALDSARRVVKLNRQESVLFFSYEVPYSRIVVDLLTAFVDDEEISMNPAESILSYYRGNGTKYMYQHLPSDEANRRFVRFRRRATTFLRDYLASGALIIADKTLTVENLLSTIDYYIATARRRVTTIYIDNAQMLFSREYSCTRTEEIKRITNSIKDFANRHNIAFVLTAQFNREVASPASVKASNIGESGDYERIADTVIGIYNLEKLQPPTGAERDAAQKVLRDLGITDVYDDRYRRVEQGHKRANPHPLTPIEGKMFARLLKRRNGYYPVDQLFDWKGRTKHVIGNNPDALLLPAEDVAIPTPPPATPADDDYSPF